MELFEQVILRPSNKQFPSSKGFFFHFVKKFFLRILIAFLGTIFSTHLSHQLLIWARANETNFVKII